VNRLEGEVQKVAKLTNRNAKNAVKREKRKEEILISLIIVPCIFLVSKILVSKKGFKSPKAWSSSS